MLLWHFVFTEKLIISIDVVAAPEPGLPYPSFLQRQIGSLDHIATEHNQFSIHSLMEPYHDDQSLWYRKN